VARNQRQRRITKLEGIRLDKSELEQAPEELISGQNVHMRDGRIVGRKGIRPIGDRVIRPDGFTDIHTYSYASSTTGETIQETIGISHDTSAGEGERLNRLASTTGTVTHSGAGVTTAKIAIAVASAVWSVTLTEDGVAVSGWPKTYSTGYDSSSGIADLLTDIGAETNWSTNFPATLSSSTVASIGYLAATSVLGGLSISMEYWEEISSEAVTDLGLNITTAPSSAERLPVSFQNSSDVCFIADNGGYLHAYDGRNYYRAGMPEFVRTPSVVLNGSGSLTGTYKYLFRYSFRDTRGNTVVGEPSITFFELSTAPSSEDVALSFPLTAL